MRISSCRQSASLLPQSNGGEDVQEINIVRKHTNQRHVKTLVFGIIACIFLLLTCIYPAYPHQPAAWAPVFFVLACVRACLRCAGWFMLASRAGVHDAGNASNSFILYLSSRAIAKRTKSAAAVPEN